MKICSKDKMLSVLNVVNFYKIYLGESVIKCETDVSVKKFVYGVEGISEFFGVFIFLGE